MPWYWSDDLARHLLNSGRMTESEASRLTGSVVAIRSDRLSLEEAAEDLAEDDDEQPTAA